MLVTAGHVAGCFLCTIIYYSCELWHGSHHIIPSVGVGVALLLMASSLHCSQSGMAEFILQSKWVKVFHILKASVHPSTAGLIEIKWIEKATSNVTIITAVTSIVTVL